MTFEVVVMCISFCMGYAFGTRTMKHGQRFMGARNGVIDRGLLFFVVFVK